MMTRILLQKIFKITPITIRLIKINTIQIIMINSIQIIKIIILEMTN